MCIKFHNLLPTKAWIQLPEHTLLLHNVAQVISGIIPLSFMIKFNVSTFPTCFKTKAVKDGKCCNYVQDYYKIIN